MSMHSTLPCILSQLIIATFFNLSDFLDLTIIVMGEA